MKVRPDPARLARLLRPRSIAVVGGKAAAEVIRQNDRLGFAGPIWPVHPREATIEGRAAFRSLADLPAEPDAVFLAVNRHLSVDAVLEAAALGAGGVACYSAGFAETGAEGAALQAALVEAAGQMPVLGPNCHGLINYLDQALLWPDQHGGEAVERGVAIVTQSGNIGLNITMQRRGLPLAMMVTMGNQACLGLSDVIAALVQDARVTAIGLHIEGLDDAAAFADAVAGARQRSVPVVALKTGRSQMGAQLTVSHTASLAGEDAVVDAFLRRIGVGRVRSITVLLEALKLLHCGGPLAGRDIASMSCSGGEAALMADLAEGRTVRFRALTPAQAARVRATLPPLVSVSNPLDYHTFSWGKDEALTETFAAILAAEFALVALILDFPPPERGPYPDWDIAVDALADAARRSGRRAAVIATLPETMPPARAAALMQSGLVPLIGMDDALAAMEAAADIGAADPTAWTPTPPCSASATTRLLTEWEGKRLLAAAGVAVPPGALATTPLGAADHADRLGYPVVVKAVSPTLAHKTERGAVRLGLADRAAVLAAATELRDLGEALLVERMIAGAVAEIIIGVRRDPLLGPYLLIGAGGVLAELLVDRAVLMLPADRAEIETALHGLRVAQMLRGWRGRPAGDVAALVDTMLAVQRAAVELGDRLEELDVNPVLVQPAGCVAVDVLIRLREENQ